VCHPDLSASTATHHFHPSQAADAIKAMLSPTAVVVRDGERTTIDADKLVPGALSDTRAVCL
jgi:magnesium-transporting ATPase (P-type)